MPPFNFSCLAGVIFNCALCADTGNVDAVRRHLAVHSLANYNNVGGGGCASKCLIVQTESTYHVAVALVGYPSTELIGAVECAVRRNENADATLAELAYVLGNAEVVNVSELAREVAVAAVVVDVHIGGERHVCYGEVDAAVLNLRFLKALDVYLRIRIEQVEYHARGGVILNGLDCTALAHRFGHKSKYVADTCRAFKDSAASETHIAGNIPHSVNDMRRGVICAVATEVCRLVGFLAEHFSELPRVFGIAERRAKTAPTAELAQYSHLFGRCLRTGFGQFLCEFYGAYVGLDTSVNALGSVVGATLCAVIVSVAAICRCYSWLALRYSRYPSASPGVITSIHASASTACASGRSSSFTPGFISSHRRIRLALLSLSPGLAGANFQIIFLSIVFCCFVYVVKKTRTVVL